MNHLPLPLAGVKVLDLSRILADPGSTQLLADYGAGVIKSERPGSGNDSRAWAPPYTVNGKAAYLQAATSAAPRLFTFILFCSRLLRRKYLNRFLAALLAGLMMGTAPSARAEIPNTAKTYVAVMCGLAGNWIGRFDRYNESGIYSTFSMDIEFQCFPDNELIMETRTYLQEDGSRSHTLAVIFPTGQAEEMQMSYFGSGIEGIYYFNAARLEIDDDEHWTMARDASQKTHESARKPPVSRYTHVRNGSKLTMIREVKPDHASPDWSLSSKLILDLQP